MTGVLLVDEPLLGGGIDGFVHGRNQFCGIVFLPGLCKVGELPHHRLQLCFVRLKAGVAHLILAHALDGGLDDWHKKRMRKTLGKARIA